MEFADSPDNYHLETASLESFYFFSTLYPLHLPSDCGLWVGRHPPPSPGYFAYAVMDSHVFSLIVPFSSGPLNNLLPIRIFSLHIPPKTALMAPFVG